MEFLKSILGDELYSQVETRVNAWNGNEANKDKLVKLANLANGEYVGKGKYDSIIGELSGKQTELDKANGLIAELQKSTQGNTDLQNRITAYQGEVSNLQKLLNETKVKNAVKVALLKEKAIDIDYLAYKIERKMKDEGKSLELDENENIKGWDDILSGLKTQTPTMFETSSQKKIIENKLPERKDEGAAITKDQFAKMNYEQRVAIKQESEQLYKHLSGKE